MDRRQFLDLAGKGALGAAALVMVGRAHGRPPRPSNTRPKKVEAKRIISTSAVTLAVDRAAPLITLPLKMRLRRPAGEPRPRQPRWAWRCRRRCCPARRRSAIQAVGRPWGSGGVGTCRVSWRVRPVRLHGQVRQQRARLVAAKAARRASVQRRCKRPKQIKREVCNIRMRTSFTRPGGVGDPIPTDFSPAGGWSGGCNYRTTSAKQQARSEFDGQECLRGGLCEHVD